MPRAACLKFRISQGQFKSVIDLYVPSNGCWKRRKRAKPCLWMSALRCASMLPA